MDACMPREPMAQIPPKHRVLDSGKCKAKLSNVQCGIRL